MRNFYLFETALKVSSVTELEDGINSLNTIYKECDDERDCFLCNPTIWECDTTQGYIYEMFNGVVNEELQRLIPVLFRSFINHNNIYIDHIQMDANFPNDCNAFIGFNFGHTIIIDERRVFNTSTYENFIKNCLKYGVISDVIKMRENLVILYPTFIFEEKAVEEILNWKNSDNLLYEKLFELFDDIPINPFMGGVGKTEVLRNMKGVASKRINIEHRVTYKLQGNEIKILACKGHYK